MRTYFNIYGSADDKSNEEMASMTLEDAFDTWDKDGLKKVCKYWADFFDADKVIVQYLDDGIKDTTYIWIKGQ